MKNRRALITGASGALGAASARRFAADGATVLLHGHSRPDALQALADEIMAAGGACSVVFTPRLNEWQGRRSVDLEVVDFQPGPVARLA